MKNLFFLLKIHATFLVTLVKNFASQIVHDAELFRVGYFQ